MRIALRGSATRSRNAVTPRLVEIQAVGPLIVVRLIGIGSSPPVDVRQHAVLVGAPSGERAEVVDDVFGVGVEDVRAVLMVLQAVGVDGSWQLPGQMGTAVDQQDVRAELACTTLSDRAACKAGAHDQDIVGGHAGLDRS